MDISQIIAPAINGTVNDTPPTQKKMKIQPGILKKNVKITHTLIAICKNNNF